MVVPTYNRGEQVRNLVRALARQSLAPDRWEVILVDDCSDRTPPPSQEELAAMCPAPLRVLRTDRNSGPDLARNVGWRAARGSLIALLDDDVQPDPCCLEAAIAAFENDPHLGLVQGRTRLPDGVNRDDVPAWAMSIDIAEPSPFFPTCNIYYRSEALAAVGGVTEDIGMDGNDSATGWAVVEAGWQHGYAQDASAVHDVDYRGFRWFLGSAWREQTAVAVAARHRGYRENAFWRPWAYRRKNAAFVAAVASGAAFLRWKPAAVGVLPYLWWSRPSRHHPRYLRTTAEVAVVDAMACAAHLVGSARHRILVL